MVRPSCIAVIVRFLMLGTMIWISSGSSAEQVRTPRRPDPQTQLLNYYRQYPDRYIRISGETWKLDDSSHNASHSFTLKNTAGVAYSEIEMRVNYLSAGGKALQSQTLKIPGILAAYGTRKIRDLKARNVPADSDQALLTVSKASIHP